MTSTKTTWTPDPDDEGSFNVAVEVTLSPGTLREPGEGAWVPRDVARDLADALREVRADYEDAEIVPDEKLGMADPHRIRRVEAAQHQATPRCGCNPDWLGEGDDAFWSHHAFGTRLPSIVGVRAALAAFDALAEGKP